MAPTSNRLSWWVGLDRAQLGQEIAKRAEGWHAQKAKFLDHLGERIVGGHEPKPRRDA